MSAGYTWARAVRAFLSEEKARISDKTCAGSMKQRSIIMMMITGSVATMVAIVVVMFEALA
jgi:hypothetical protein